MITSEFRIYRMIEDNSLESLLSLLQKENSTHLIYEFFIHSCKWNHILLAKNLVERYPYVLTYDVEFRYLDDLIAHKNAEIFKFCISKISKDIIIHEINDKFITACHLGNFDIASSILDYAPLYFYYNHNQNDAFRSACKTGAIEIVEKLLALPENKIRISDCNYEAIYNSVENGHLDIFSKLTDLIDPNKRIIVLSRSLYLSVKFGKGDIFDYIESLKIEGLHTYSTNQMNKLIYGHAINNLDSMGYTSHFTTADLENDNDEFKVKFMHELSHKNYMNCLKMIHEDFSGNEVLDFISRLKGRLEQTKLGFALLGFVFEVLMLPQFDSHTENLINELDEKLYPLYSTLIQMRNQQTIDSFINLLSGMEQNSTITKHINCILTNTYSKAIEDADTQKISHLLSTYPILKTMEDTRVFKKMNKKDSQDLVKTIELVHGLTFENLNQYFYNWYMDETTFDLAVQLAKDCSKMPTFEDITNTKFRDIPLPPSITKKLLLHFPSKKIKDIKSFKNTIINKLKSIIESLDNRLDEFNECLDVLDLDDLKGIETSLINYWTDMESQNGMKINDKIYPLIEKSDILKDYNANRPLIDLMLHKFLLKKDSFNYGVVLKTISQNLTSEQRQNLVNTVLFHDNAYGFEILLDSTKDNDFSYQKTVFEGTLTHRAINIKTLFFTKYPLFLTHSKDDIIKYSKEMFESSVLHSLFIHHLPDNLSPEVIHSILDYYPTLNRYDHVAIEEFLFFTKKYKHLFTEEMKRKILHLIGKIDDELILIDVISDMNFDTDENQDFFNHMISRSVVNEEICILEAILTLNCINPTLNGFPSLIEAIEQNNTVMIDLLTSWANSHGYGNIAREILTNNNMPNRINYQQSIHMASVEKSCFDSAIRLRNRYQDRVKNEDINNIYRNLIEIVEQNKPGNQTSEIATVILRNGAILPIDPHSAAKRYIKKLKNSNELTSYRESSEMGISISLRELLCYVYFALNDAEVLEASPDVAKSLFTQACYDCQRGNNLIDVVINNQEVTKDNLEHDNTICPGGQFNKFIESLSNIHPDCTIIVQNKASANLKFKTLVNEHIHTFCMQEISKLPDANSQGELFINNLIDSQEKQQEMLLAIKAAVLNILKDEYETVFSNVDELEEMWHFIQYLDIDAVLQACKLKYLPKNDAILPMMSALQSVESSNSELKRPRDEKSSPVEGDEEYSHPEKASKKYKPGK